VDGRVVHLTMDQTCPNMLHSLHSRHVWMHGHVLVWFPAGKAPASRSPTMSSRCHPLRGCEGEGEWKLAPRARAATAPRARFEALTSDRSPSTRDSPATPPRASRRRGLPLSPANGGQMARAPTPFTRASQRPLLVSPSLAHFLHLVNRAAKFFPSRLGLWARLVSGSCPGSGKMLGDGA